MPKLSGGRRAAREERVVGEMGQPNGPKHCCHCGPCCLYFTAP